MEAHNPIPIYVREIDEMALTKWGQIKLTGFPEAAIAHARQAMKHSRAARNPYGLFFNAALDYCKANNLQVDWKKVDFLKETYQMPENASMILATKNQSQGMKGSGQSASTKREQVPEDFFKNLAGRIQEVSQEDPYAAALRVERHYETEAGSKFVQYCGRINPWMERLPKEDQQRILEIITNERNHEETTRPAPSGEPLRGQLTQQHDQVSGHTTIPQEDQTQTLNFRQLFNQYTQEKKEPSHEAQAISG